MAKAISATGKSKSNSFSEWVEIRIKFDDGTERVLDNVTATVRQIFQLAKTPEAYQEILNVDG